MILPDIHGGADGRWRIVAIRDERGDKFLWGAVGYAPRTAIEAASYEATMAPFTHEDEQGLYWGAREFALRALTLARAAYTGWDQA